MLKYRVPNNREGALQDLQRCLSPLVPAQRNGDRLGRLGVLVSPPAESAAKASTQFDQRAYPPSMPRISNQCRPDFAVLVYPAYLQKDGVVAPDLNLKAKIPPTSSCTPGLTHRMSGTRSMSGAHRGESPAPIPALSAGGHGYGLHCTKDAKAWRMRIEWLRTLP